jgi:hypothetical protein
MVCPSLTPDEVKQIIQQGNINADPERTLAAESGKSPREVIADEPSANPHDTYYNISVVKYVNKVPYILYIGNVLGKSKDEAKERATKILLSSNLKFNGHVFDPTTCMYKEVHASKEIPTYPYKSHYETVVLIAGDASEMPHGMLQDMKVLKS